MRHRIASGIGLGNPAKEILDNKGKLPDVFCENALAKYFSNDQYFDFKINKKFIMIGVEPAYQYERLKIIKINEVKELSKITTGRAWGPYGTQVGSTTKYYYQYKLNCKFTRFIDRWHAYFFGNKK